MYVLRKIYLRLWVVVKMVTQKNIKKKVGKKFPFLKQSERCRNKKVRLYQRIFTFYKGIGFLTVVRFGSFLILSPPPLLPSVSSKGDTQK